MTIDVGSRSRLRNWTPFIWLGLLIALAYGGAIQNEYVWDDTYFFGDYFWVHDIRTAIAVSFDPLFGQRSYVRPLPLLMLYAEALASDRNPAVSHFFNLAIHFGCSCLVFLLARRAVFEIKGSLCNRTLLMPALLASVFAVHPALSEAPIWISSRFDLMATLCALLALWVAGLEIRDLPRAIALGAIFFVGALCKESIAVLPLLLGTYALLRGDTMKSCGVVDLKQAFRPRELKAYASLFVAGVLYLVVRVNVLSGSDIIDIVRPGPIEWLSRITTALSTYLKLTAMPFMGSSPHHTWTWPSDGSLAAFWPAHLTTLVFVMAATALAWRRQPAGWLLLAWMAAYLPVLHLVPLPIGQNVVHQRFMYLPTAALLAMAPYALARITMSRAARTGMIALTLVLVAVAIPVDRSIVQVWRSDLALWTWATRTQPESTEARENLIWSQLELGMYKEAEKEFLHVVSIGMPTSANLAVNMGTAAYRQGEFEGALHYYRKAEEHQSVLSSTFRSRLLANLGITNALLGNSEESRRYLEESLRENARNHQAIAHLLAYCEGIDIDTTRFSPQDLERALAARDAAVGLLMEHQPTLQSERAFCPSVP